MDVTLREVREADLEVFYEDQRDPEACAMAAFPSRERDAFRAHWEKILADPAVAKQTIVADGEVAGNLVAWPQDGHRLVGYWVGRRFWSRGVGSRALAQFVQQLERPLIAWVAVSNAASVRVLQKCGFVREGAPQAGRDGVVEVRLALR